MTIRKATNDETQKILRHSLEVLKEATMGHVKPRKRKALELISPLLSNGGYYLVYIEDKKIAGWIGVGSIMDINTDEMVGVLPEVYVLPKYRHRGIAKKLCNEAFTYLKRDGYQKVQLNIFSGNAAKKIYEDLGFKEISTTMEKNIT
ncbi:GNAT family N-acetyltransferase [Bacillus sinesaloumensis]|uniref:GNAT family N-acetyltransferase n=1 Tax=Litchfieldia sinesaloumensis TaxID=1926280 RepID=UPI000988787C|nr:GNAT family N-acetyltransferase [Bacillus sinesaloumensis]